MPRRPFKGKINVDVRDSVPDWEPYMPPRAPDGSGGGTKFFQDSWPGPKS